MKMTHLSIDSPQIHIIEDVLFTTVILFIALFFIKPHLLYYYPDNFLYTSVQSIAQLPDLTQMWLDKSFPGALCDRVGSFFMLLSGRTGFALCFITALAACITILTGHIFRQFFSNQILLLLRFVPALLMTLDYCKYTHAYRTDLSMLFVLVCVWLYTLSKPWQKLFRFVVFIFLSIAIVYTTNTYALFVALCVLFEILVVRSRYYSLLLLIGLAGFATLSSLIVPALSLQTIIAHSFPFFAKPDVSVSSLLTILFSFAPILIILFSKICSLIPLVHKVFLKINNRTIEFVFFIILITFFLGFAYLFQNTKKRLQMQCSYYCQKQNWPSLIKALQQIPHNQFSIVNTHVLNRALFHEGKLLNDMMKYPQSEDALFLINTRSFTQVTIHQRWVWSAWTMFELGAINNAENITYEALTMHSHYPEGLRLLGLIHAVKNMPFAARTCFSSLAKDINYAKIATEYLRKLDADSTMQNDSLVCTARRNAVTSDNIQGLSMELLLAKNPHNKMAFEYLIANLLLINDLDGLANATHYLSLLNYTKIPRLYQEALFIYRNVLRKDLPSETIYLDAETENRFVGFLQLFSQYGRNKDQALQALAKSYGDSYFFYNLYGFTGSMVKSN